MMTNVVLRKLCRHDFVLQQSGSPKHMQTTYPSWSVRTVGPRESPPSISHDSGDELCREGVVLSSVRSSRGLKTNDAQTSRSMRLTTANPRSSLAVHARELPSHGARRP